MSFTGQLSDVSNVEKYEISEADYAKRQGREVLVISLSIELTTISDSVLAYKQRHKVGRFADKPPVEEEETTSMDVDIRAGSRCEVESLEPGLKKRGTVRFVGETKFSKGIWVGIEYDEPFGKNDGL